MFRRADEGGIGNPALAENSGISEASLSRWRRGLNTPNAGLLRLANAALDDLLSRSDAA